MNEHNNVVSIRTNDTKSFDNAALHRNFRPCCSGAVCYPSWSSVHSPKKELARRKLSTEGMKK